MGSTRLRAATITLAVFVSGGVLLGLEIAASRVVAPFFGNSLYVWGALIGVVLAGLAVGYWAGGTLADRRPSAELLVAVIVLGAAGVLAVPLLDGPVLRLVVSWDPGPRADPVLAALLLFGWPSVVLAAVTPVAVRLRARELERLGRDAGRLFSVSTFGSIAGTFLTAFWLVPALGVDQLVAVGAAALFAAAAVVALAHRQVLPLAAAAAACGAALAVAFSIAPQPGATVSGAAARNWSPVWRLRGVESSERQEYVGTVRYRKDTQYHRLAVVDAGDLRELRFDSSFQSAMSLSDPYATQYRYTDYLQLARAYNPSARNVLLIGLGGGSIPKRMLRDFPDVRMQVVELDPAVVDVAHRFFRVPRDEPRLSITVADGRRFLQRDDRRWDAILVDAFYADSIPFHMATREFVELARSRLAPGGVVAVNVIGALAGDGSNLFRSMFETYAQEFPTVTVHPVVDYAGESDESTRNLILVATNERLPGKDELLARWRRVRADAPTAPDLRRAIRDRYEGVVSPDGVPVLTDDYAPTDALLME